MGLKKEELLNPQSCLNKAADHEPVFVLRAKDPLAANAVRDWADSAERHGLHPEKTAEARELANHMDDWRIHNVPG